MSQPEPINILMIEDNQGDVELAKIAFGQGGIPCTINVAYDGKEGLEYLRKQGEFKDATTPDLILLDINMPCMDGKECLAAMKEDEALKSVPVIMLTSSKSPKDVEECYKKHTNAYIIKPNGADAFVNFAENIKAFWVGLAELPNEGGKQHEAFYQCKTGGDFAG